MDSRHQLGSCRVLQPLSLHGAGLRVSRGSLNIAIDSTERLDGHSLNPHSSAASSGEFEGSSSSSINASERASLERMAVIHAVEYGSTVMGDEDLVQAIRTMCIGGPKTDELNSAGTNSYASSRRIPTSSDTKKSLPTTCLASPISRAATSLKIHGHYSNSASSRSSPSKRSQFLQQNRDDLLELNEFVVHGNQLPLKDRKEEVFSNRVHLPKLEGPWILVTDTNGDAVPDEINGSADNGLECFGTKLIIDASSELPGDADEIAAIRNSNVLWLPDIDAKTGPVNMVAQDHGGHSASGSPSRSMMKSRAGHRHSLICGAHKMDKPRKASLAAHVNVLPPTLATSELGLAEGNSFHLRNEYGRNMEKRWLQQMQEERRKAREERRVKRWMHERVKVVKEEDDFFKSFYSSDSEDAKDELEQGPKPSSSPEGSKRGNSAVTSVSRPSSKSRSKSATSSVGRDEEEPMPSPRLLRYASLDVLVSDSDHDNESLSSDVDIVLKENDLHDTKVKYKMRKKRHRQYHKYKAMVDAADAASEEEAEEEFLTDRDIRAMRLKLDKKSTDEPIVMETNMEDLRRMAAELLANFQKRAFPKRRKKRKKRKNQQQPVTYLTDNLTLQERFMRDFGFLVRKPLSARTQDGSVTDDTGPRKSKLQLALESFESDKELLDKMPGGSLQGTAARTPECLSKAPSVAHSRPVSQASRAGSGVSAVLAELMCDEDDEEEELKDHVYHYNGEIFIRPHPMATRRDSDPGNQRLMKLVYNRKVPKPQKGEKKAKKIPQQNASPAGEDTSSPSGQAQSDVADETLQEKTSPPLSRSGSASSLCSSLFTDVSEVIDLEDVRMRRSLSARRLKPREQEIDLWDLTEGIDFPAKDIKIKIINRRRRRMRQKSRLRQLSRQNERRESDDLSMTPSPTDRSASAANSKARKKRLPMFLAAFQAFNRGAANYRLRYSAEELDAEIEQMGDLFWQMKDCRYIRWSKRYLAILDRLHELYLLDGIKRIPDWVEY